MYITIAAVGGLALGGGLVAFVLAGPIPFWDRGFRVFAASSEQARTDLAEILAEFGLKPRYRIDSRSILRVLMSDNETVINYTKDDDQFQGRRVAAGLALVVNNPWEAAEKAARWLRLRGYEAKVLGELDPYVPKGAMVFVSTNAFIDTLLVFRKHFFKMGKRPPNWRYRLPVRGGLGDKSAPSSYLVDVILPL